MTRTPPAGRDDEAAPSVVLVIAIMALSQFALTSDFSLVSLAIPSIGRDMHAAPALLSWVGSATALTFAGFLLFGGKLTDLWGQRRCLQIGLGLFGLGSLCAAFAPSIWLLIPARAIEGLGAALASPASFSLINTLVPEGPQRHRALSVFGIMQGLSLILGLALGGYIVSAFGWRIVFAMNIVLVATLLLMVARTIPARLDRAAVAPENVFAATLIAVATALFVLALSLYVRDGIAALLPLAVLAAACVGFVCFYAYERRSAAPLIPRVVYTPALVRSCAAGLGLLGGVAGLMYVSSLYMQDALGFSAARTGVNMLPYAFAVILSGHFLPKLLTRLPARGAAIFGFAVNIVGILLLVAAAGQARYGVFMYAGLIIAPIGSLSGFLATISEATAAASPEQQGLTSAALFMAHQIGIALGGTTCLAVATALDGTGSRALPYVGAYLAAAVLPLLGMLALWAPSRGPMIRAPA